MGAPTEIYADPSIAANSGTGAIGDPYGDLQYALDQVTRDSTNGDRFNVKAGTDEILSSSLSLATYGTPSEAAPLIFQGYTSAAADGGVGGISGNGSVSIISDANLDDVKFIDLHLHNTGSALIARLDDRAVFVRCEIDNTTTDGLDLDLGALIVGCHIHNIGDIGIDVHSGFIFGNYLENGTNDFTTAIRAINFHGPTIIANIISIDGSSDGIETDSMTNVLNNSIWSNGGTGAGVVVNNSGQRAGMIANNVAEGFSGTGGIGYELTSDGILYVNNAAYDNATNYSATGNMLLDLGGNEILLASPFTDAANGDFTLVDTGNVKAGAYPTGNYPNLSVRAYLDKGALQRQESAGGVILTGMTGGMNG